MFDSFGFDSSKLTLASLHWLMDTATRWADTSPVFQGQVAYLIPRAIPDLYLATTCGIYNPSARTRWFDSSQLTLASLCSIMDTATRWADTSPVFQELKAYLLAQLLVIQFRFDSSEL